MQTMFYAIQCKDIVSGLVGDFSYDLQQCQGGFVANSPVFDGLQEFYSWAKEQGYKTPPGCLQNIMVRDAELVDLLDPTGALRKAGLV